MNFQLRDYQQILVDKVIGKLKEGYKRPLVILPTGGGKTAISSQLSKMAYAKGSTVYFNVHRRELVTQTYNTFLKVGIEPSFIQTGKRYDPKNPVQIASVQTLAKKIDEIPAPDVYFDDEAHHNRAAQWQTIADKYSEAIHIGLTATPIRLDGKDLGEVFDCMVEVCSTKWLIDNGYLVNYQYFAPSSVDISALKKRNGEYTKDSLEKANFESTIVGDNIEYYKKYAMGRRNVVFARNVKQSQRIVEKYNAEGIPAKHLDGTTPVGERDKAIKDFERGDILVLSNVDLFGEGFDLPAIEVVSLLTVSNSLSRVIQWWGRGLRAIYAKGYDLSTSDGRLAAIAASEKPFAMIFDHGNNYETHGQPNWERNWTLGKDGAKNGSAKGLDDGLTMKCCAKCFKPYLPAVKCPHCGHGAEVDNKEIKEVEGELFMVNSDEYKQAMRRVIKTVTTFEELVELEAEMNYKHGWAENQWKARTGENLKGSLEGLQKIADVRGYKRGWAYGQWKRRGGR